jgi:HSF-type DNA-binding
MSRTTPNGPEPNPNARFPEQLHRALSEMASKGLDYIASWQPHGRSFKIHDTQAFVQLVLGRYVVVFPALFHIETPVHLKELTCIVPISLYIMHSWFDQTKFTSFQRQLNIYDFERIGSGTYVWCILCMVKRGTAVAADQDSHVCPFYS